MFSLQFSLGVYTMKYDIDGYTSSSVAVDGVSLLGVLAFQETLEICEKKKCTPVIAVMAPSISNLFEAICFLASSTSSFQTRQVARHDIALCLSLI